MQTSKRGVRGAPQGGARRRQLLWGLRGGGKDPGPAESPGFTPIAASLKDKATETKNMCASCPSKRLPTTRPTMPGFDT